jgi:hypothetical protein
MQILEASEASSAAEEGHVDPTKDQDFMKISIFNERQPNHSPHIRQYKNHHFFPVVVWMMANA